MSRDADCLGIVVDGAERWLAGEMADVDARLGRIDEELMTATASEARQELLEERVALEEARRHRWDQVAREAKDAFF